MGMPVQDITLAGTTSMCSLSSSIQQAARMAAAWGLSDALTVVVAGRHNG